MLTVLGIVVGLWLLTRLWEIVVLLAIALVLAGTLSPLVDWLEQRRIGRSFALGLILLGLVLGTLGLAALVIPALIGQVQALIAGAPAMQNRLADTLAQFPPLANEATSVRTATPEALLAPLGASALSVAGSVVDVVALGLTTAVLAFYILADRERVQGLLFALLPRHVHLRVARILLDMETVVGGYIRGQALTSALISAFVFVLLWRVGTPNALAFGAFAGFADLIPFVGGILVLIPAVAATLPVGLVPAIVVFAAIFLYQQFESHVLIPRVYGRTLRLSAVAVTLALLAGGTLLGIIGALLALPVAAGIRVIVQDLRIDLPGEQSGEAAQHVEEEQAEAAYAAQTQGATATEAAAVATAMLVEQDEQEREAAEQVEGGGQSASDEGSAATGPLPLGVPPDRLAAQG